jgi:hypothetical protein
MGITMFSVQMAISGVAKQFSQCGWQMAQSIAIYIISSSICGFGASVQRTNLAIMSMLTSNTPLQNQNLYRMLCDANSNMADTKHLL